MSVSRTLRIIVAALTLLALCVPAGAASPKIVLVHWQHHHEARTPLLKELAQDFMKTHPDIEIRFEPIPYDSYFDKVITSLVSGTGPDTFQIPMEMGQQMIRAGVLAPVPDEVMATDQITKTFLPWTVKQFFYKGEYYGLPTDVQTLVLFINNKLYKEAGFDPKTPPKTWKEFEEQAIKCTKRDSEGRIVQAGLDTRYRWAVYSLFVYQNMKGNVVDVENKKVLYDSPEGIAAWQFIDRLMNQDRVDSPTFLTGQKKFEQGKAVFYINHPVTRGRLERECPGIDWSMAPVPSPDGKPVTVGHNWAYVVNRNSKNSKAAWEWVKFLTSRDSQIKSVLQTGELPSDVSLIGADVVTPDAKAKVAMESLKYAEAIQDVAMPESDAIHNEIWDNIVLKHMNPAEAVKLGAAKETKVMQEKLR